MWCLRFAISLINGINHCGVAFFLASQFLRLPLLIRSLFQFSILFINGFELMIPKSLTFSYWLWMFSDASGFGMNKKKSRSCLKSTQILSVNACVNALKQNSWENRFFAAQTHYLCDTYKARTKKRYVKTLTRFVHFENSKFNFFSLLTRWRTHTHTTISFIHFWMQSQIISKTNNILVESADDSTYVN